MPSCYLLAHSYHKYIFYLFVFTILLLLKIIILKKYATKAAKMDSLLEEKQNF